MQSIRSESVKSKMRNAILKKLLYFSRQARIAAIGSANIPAGSSLLQSTPTSAQFSETARLTVECSVCSSETRQPEKVQPTSRTFLSVQRRKTQP